MTSKCATGPFNVVRTPSNSPCLRACRWYGYVDDMVWNGRIHNNYTFCRLVPVRYRPNAASGGWSYWHDFVMMTYEGGTGRMPHLVGGAMGMTLSWWHMKGVHPVWNGYIILLNIHKTFNDFAWLVHWPWLLTLSCCLSRHTANCSTALSKVFSRGFQVYQCIRTHKTEEESMWVAYIMAYCGTCTHSYWSSCDSPSLGNRPVFHGKVWLVTLIGVTNSLSTSNFWDDKKRACIPGQGNK